MLLKGKHALERSGQILKELSTCRENGAAKSFAMSLSENDASFADFVSGPIGPEIRRKNKITKGKPLCMDFALDGTRCQQQRTRRDASRV